MAHLMRLSDTAKLIVIILQVQVLAAQEWSIRLQDGATPFEGRIEVLIEDDWGTVMDTNWSIDGAQVVCRQLGFSNAQAETLGDHVSPADPDVKAHLANVVCTGEEVSLSECSYQKLNQSYYRSHSRDAGVICAVEYSLRLDNGNIGRLELQSANSWIPICFSTAWQREEATVACKQLGYEQVQSYQGITSDTTGGSVTISSLNCTGNEFHIHSCQNLILTQGSCSNGLVLQIECIGRPLSPHLPRVTYMNCSSVSLNWDSPDSRGVSIESYIVRYRPIVHVESLTDSSLIELPIWTEVIHTQSTNMIMIDGLRPFVDYEFQVSAVNNIGASPFSKSATFFELGPEIDVPDNLRVDERGPRSTTISWRIPMTCGLSNVTYEVTYHIQGSQFSSFSFHDTVMATEVTTNPDSTMQYILQSLLPFTGYSVKVRVVGYVDTGNEMSTIDNGLMGRTLLVASNYSVTINFKTQKSAPSGSPQAFTAFLTQLQSAAHFQWKPVSPHLTNGFVTGYSLSCRYQKDGLWKWRRENLDNSTFSFDLDSLVPATEYECSVAAANEIGQGPDSTPIFFLTPADLNRRPSAPRNVAFAIVSPNSDRNSFSVQATWEMNTCQSNFSCIELLGYVISCRAENTLEDMTLTIWLSDIEVSDTSEFLLPVKPFTRYTCSMASMNTYGVGLPGSLISVRTPETKPSESPMQLYATNLGVESVFLHWTYNETPRAGTLVGFAVNVYEHVSRYPERDGKFVIREEFFTTNVNQDEINFVYHLMYLSPGVEYNILVSALTNAGEGPQGRVSFTTLRLAPQVVPTSVQTELPSNVEPFPIIVRWSLPQSSSSQQADHVGFIIHCYTNGSDGSSYTSILTHPVFTNEILSDYSDRLLFPARCGSETLTYYCAVSAFNENGEGMRSQPGSFRLLCSGTGGGSFLTDPYTSISFLSIIILLAVILVVSLILCCLCLSRNGRRMRKDERYTTVGGYDEGYISMAPSGSTTTAIKSRWSRNDSFPSTINAGISTRLSLEHEGSPFNHYDEIPGERLSKTENVYDEIPLRITPTIGRETNSSVRSSPALLQVTCPSIHSISSCHSDNSCDFDESQVTTMTDITKVDSTDKTKESKSQKPSKGSHSSEESLVKLKEMSGGGKTWTADSVSLTSRRRASGYVQVLTSKDGKKYVREDGRVEHVSPVAGYNVTDQPMGDPSKEHFHSYQNVSDIRRPASASSKSCHALDVDTGNVSTSATGRNKVSSADFQLSTTTDSNA